MSLEIFHTTRSYTWEWRIYKTKKFECLYEDIPTKKFLQEQVHPRTKRNSEEGIKKRNKNTLQKVK